MQYYYLISEGAFSSYEVTAIVAHERCWAEDEMEELLKGKPRSEDIGMYLSKQNFTMIYPVGDIHVGNYSKDEDPFYDAFPVEEKGENSLSLGLG